MKWSETVKTLGLVVILSAAAWLGGCSDSATNSNPKLIPASGNILGLQDGRTLDYIRIDSTITYYPSLRRTVDTGTQIVTISGADNDWTLSDENGPLISLKLSEPFVLQNGYWRKVGGLDAQVIYPIPAVVIDTRMQPGDSLEATVPLYTSDSGTQRFAFMYAYFGFYVRKYYRGQEQILTPAWAGNAHRFDVDLYLNQSDSSPMAKVVEYYAPGLGLVRWEFRGDGFTRVLTLRNVI